MNAIERLEALLNEKDEALAAMGEKLDSLQKQLDNEWFRVIESPEAEGLPVPRLEIRWAHDDDQPHGFVATYSLVYPHLLGHVLRVPLSYTKTSGSGPIEPDGTVRTPFRDGVHMMHDAWALKLPSFCIFGKVVTACPAGTKEQVQS